MVKNIFILVVMVCICNQVSVAQNCTNLGQNPGTAFPVCGTATFTQGSVPVCGGKAIPGPCGGVLDTNPYWYKFTCFGAGTLGFTIAPVNASDDYDWQIFDITNRNPDDVFTDAALFVACNWSGETGNTGTNVTATSLKYCDGLGVPLFSAMPNLIVGHQYLLLISHFSGDSQSGYALKFDGGTANITDPVAPHLLAASAACDGTSISVKLNKKMKCSSLDADGSDFTISPAIAVISGATGVGCSSSFDMDSVVLTLATPLPAGNYTLSVRPNNNLLDNCNNFIPATDSLKVTVYPLVPTPMDSLAKIGCAPDVLQLVFRDRMRCSSIAADGSDFIVTGTSIVSVAAASGTCNANGLTNTIQVKLSSPIQNAGAFSIKLVTGTDGNTIINECGKETAAGASVNFVTVDTVSALFTSIVKLGCVTDTILYSHDGANGVNNWAWVFDNTTNSSLQNNQLTYTVFNSKTATLIVSNGTCRDSATASVNLDNAIKAAFEGTSVVCPGDPATFKDASTGNLSSWLWNFGNGNTSNIQAAPIQFYPPSNTVSNVTVQLIVGNNIGCYDTAVNTIRVVGNCYIAVPKAFSPNGDGLNDYLYPNNAYKAKELVFTIYNRGGEKIFETKDWTKKWDGTFKGNLQDPGTYVWVLSYTNIESGKRIEQKGSTVLIR